MGHSHKKQYHQAILLEGWPKYRTKTCISSLGGLKHNFHSREREQLVDANDWRCQTKDVPFSTKVPAVNKGKSTWHSKASTMKMPDQDYNTSVWTHVYTDGSCGAAVRNGGIGIHIRSSDENTLSRSLAAGALEATTGSNFTALRKAARLHRHHTCPTSSSLPTTSLLSKAYSHQESNSKKDTQRLLCDLPQHSKVDFQWITAHCGLAGNEEVIVLQSPAADRSSST